MLAGHASRCWRSELGAGMPYNREQNESKIYLFLAVAHFLHYFPGFRTITCYWPENNSILHLNLFWLNLRTKYFFLGGNFHLRKEVKKLSLHRPSGSALKVWGGGGGGGGG